MLFRKSTGRAPLLRASCTLLNAGCRRVEFVRAGYLFKAWHTCVARLLTVEALHAVHRATLAFIALVTLHHMSKVARHRKGSAGAVHAPRGSWSARQPFHSWSRRTMSRLLSSLCQRAAPGALARSARVRSACTGQPCQW